MASQIDPERLPQYVHFYRTFRQVDECTWIIGGRVLIKLLQGPKDKTSWPVGDGKGWYHASEAPNPRPKSTPIRDFSRFKLVRSWQEEGAMWEIGQCVLRAQLRIGSCDTKEADTLRALEGWPLSLQVPAVYADFEFDGYEYVIYSKLDGVSLSKVWGSLDEDDKNRCVLQIAKFCKELATWERHSSEGVGGVDGSHMRDAGILVHYWTPSNTPRVVLENCEAMGMDCSRLVFAHNLLSAGNVIFHPEKCVVGIQNWVSAGFIPEEKIRACVSRFDKDLGEDWKCLMQTALSAEGFSFPKGKPFKDWHKEMQPERSILQSQYWATVGREKRLKAEEHILDVTKPSENPGVPPTWDDAQPEIYGDLTFSVPKMIMSSFYYPSL
ncbi:hypothetical protein NCS52_00032600 [Fusarium sp. LHS14.1]|nr:hypothetical protein NCS52_00032600 [Fusarium sp. LHS14.1]